MILDHEGRPLTPQKDESLSLAAEALIEVKVNTAMERARQEIRQIHRADNMRNWIKFAVWSSIAAIGIVLTYLYGPEKVEEWTQKYVNENMTQESFTRAADAAMDNRIRPYIDNKMHPLEVRNQNLESNIKMSEVLFDELRDRQQFLLLVFRSENHDFHAFSELEHIGKKHNALSSEAVKITNNIKNRLIRERKDRFVFKYFMLGDAPHVRFYPDIYSTEELLETLSRGDRELASDLIRLGGFSSLLPWLINILENERNINVLNRITETISGYTGVEVYPWDIPKIMAWWGKVKHRYKQFDYASYKSGLDAFFRGNWKTALEHFTKAIESDNRADISRSLGIFCTINENDMMTAKNMLKEFMNQTYNKWAILARAKILLVEGTIKEGTELLIDLSIQHPRMEEFILMGQEVFLNEADWQYYHARRNLGRWVREGQN